MIKQEKAKERKGVTKWMKEETSQNIQKQRKESQKEQRKDKIKKYERKWIKNVGRKRRGKQLGDNGEQLIGEGKKDRNKRMRKNMKKTKCINCGKEVRRGIRR